MKDKEFEKELFQSLDSICANELEGLQETVELTAQHMTLDDGTKARISSKALGKAGITMSDNKHESHIRAGKKKRISVIAAFAAAAAITVTAGAYAVTDGFRGADINKAAETLFGKGHEAISEARSDNTGHLKVREEIALCDGRNILAGISLEPIDEIGQGYLENSENICINPMGCSDRAGKSDMYSVMSGGGGQVTDGCCFIFCGVELSYKEPLNEFYDMPDDEVFDLWASVQSFSQEQLIEGKDGEPLSDISFKVTKNAELIPMKGDKGHTLEISKVGLYINGYNHRFMNKTDDGEVFEDYSYDIYKPVEGSYVTIEFKDGSKADADDYASSASVIDLGNDEEYGINMHFSRPLDTDSITGITIKDEHFTVEQS